MRKGDLLILFKAKISLYILQRLSKTNIRPNDGTVRGFPTPIMFTEIALVLWPSLTSSTAAVTSSCPPTSWRNPEYSSFGSHPTRFDTHLFINGQDIYIIGGLIFLSFSCPVLPREGGKDPHQCLKQMSNNSFSLFCVCTNYK